MLFAMLTIAATLASTPQSQPSFDCDRASTPVERAICADPELARLDRQMAARFQVLRRDLGPLARTALLEDQRDFLWARDEIFDATGPKDRLDYLREDMASRVEFLEIVSTEPPAGLFGQWANFRGIAVVSAQADGTVRVQAQAAEPITARWTCDFDVNARIEGAKAHGVPADTPELEFGGNWAINVERQGGVLQIEECCSAGYCGFNGTISGRYLAVDRVRLID